MNEIENEMKNEQCKPDSPDEMFHMSMRFITHAHEGKSLETRG